MAKVLSRKVFITACCAVFAVFAQDSACQGVPAQRDTYIKEFVEIVYGDSSDQLDTSPFLLRLSAKDVELAWSVIIDRLDKSLLRYDKNKILYVYDAAIRMSRLVKNKDMLARTYCKRGRYYSVLGDWDQAYYSYKKCGELFDDLGSVSNIVGVLGIMSPMSLALTLDGEADYYSRRCIEIVQSNYILKNESDILDVDVALSSALAVRGGLLFKQGDYSQALQCYHGAIEVLKRLNKRDRLVTYNLSDNLASMGSVYAVMGRNKEAISYYNQALSIARKHFHVDRIARSLNNMGLLLLYQEDYMRAIMYFKEAIKIYESIKNRSEVAIATLNLGVAYQKAEDYKHAEDLFNESYEVAGEINNIDVTIAAGEGLGAIYRIRGDYDKAMEILGQSLALARKLDDKTRIAEVLWRMAEVHYDKGEFDKAINLGNQSFELARQLQFSNLSILTSTLVAKSLINNKDAASAEDLLKSAVYEIENQRNRIAGREHSQQLYFENKVTPYHLLIDIDVARGDKLSALEHAERVKGRALLDSLRKGRAAVKNVMSENDRIERRRLNQIISGLNRALRMELQKAAQDQERVERIKTDLADARLKYSTFMDLLESPVSAASDRSVSALANPFESEVLDGLPRDTLFISYTVTDNRTWIFLVSYGSEGAQLDIKPLDITREDLRSRVSNLHQALSERSLRFNAISREVYDLLIEPVGKSLAGRKKLCIIPDDVLWDAPFQTLINGKGKYLIEDHSISYAPSLNVYLLMMRKNRHDLQSGGDSLLAFGNPLVGVETTEGLRDQQRGGSYDPLPHAEIEVKAVLPMFRNKRSMALIGSEAEERRFKSLAGEYRTIHLATHGVLDNQNPLYSYLLLARKNDDAEEDGILEAREILEMELKADMAVLSACETARGRIGMGEGVVGMAWAFFVAGCRSTIVSQWRVDSEGTARFMIDFYKGLEGARRRGGGSKSEALRAAALRMLGSIRYRHPYYWAGFILIGSDN